MNSVRKFSTLKNSFYVTTPIFYVNASPHIGHLYSAVIADTIQRYEKLKSPQSKIIFSTGTDEHGTKVQQAALKNTIPVEKYCDKISESYKNTFRNANIDFTNFIRTTNERHKKAVHKFWLNLKERGHIFSSQYKGWYCVSDESFLTESQLKIETDGSKVSIESGHPVEWTEELNYMFSLSKFQEDVIYWIKNSNRITPYKFEKILLDYLNEPLPDISISRPLKRVQWGIPVPGDETQTIYVWLDALVNYLTCAGYPGNEFLEKWPPNVQVIGKDILKFHGIYWPAFLIASGLEPPSRLLVHSHWLVEGQKMSKSKFNVVDPNDCSNLYTMQGLRYFLLREGVPHSDGNYSEIKISRILNTELADSIGNLLSRCCAKSLNLSQLNPKIDHMEFKRIFEMEFTKKLLEKLYDLPDKCAHHYDNYKFYLVIEEVILTMHSANNFFENSKPWLLKKTVDQKNLNKLNTILGVTMDTLRICGIILQPIIPELATKILDKLSILEHKRSWSDIKFSKGLNGNADGINLSEFYLKSIEEEENEKSLSQNVDAVLFNRILGSKKKLELKHSKEKNITKKQTNKL